jgi:Xaa-Pro aminopeptidase
MRRMPAALLLPALLAAAPPAAAPSPAPPAAPAVRAERDKAAIHDRLVRARLDRLLLPAMRAHGVQLWVVLTREDATDPLFPFLTLDGSYPGARNAYLFADDGGPRARRLVIGSHSSKQAWGFYDEVIEARGADVPAQVRTIVERLQPARIAVNEAAETAAADGLSASGKALLLEALGPFAGRVVSAEGLVIDLMEPRLPEELPYLREAAAITRATWEEVLSARAVTPGVTTVGDLLWRARQRLADLHVGTWFRPDVRIQRRGQAFDPSVVAEDGAVIQAGDVLHLDVGVTHLGQSTDYQRMAYVARPGELDAPPGLRRALAAANRLQDLLLAELRPGRAGHEAHAAAMAKAGAEGLSAMIYSHSLGSFGHFVGAAIGSFGGGGKASFRASLPLREGALYAVELNARTPVPEWDGQELWVMLEEDALLEPGGARFVLPRQEAWVVIR